MSDEVKKDEVKVEGIYPDYPSPPYCPPDMNPHYPEPDPHMNTLMEKLRCLMGQQATVYADGLVFTGTVHAVGEGFIELHMMQNNTQRTAYIMFDSIVAVVPGGPLGVEMAQPSTPGIL